MGGEFRRPGLMSRMGAMMGALAAVAGSAAGAVASAVRQAATSIGGAPKFRRHTSWQERRGARIKHRRQRKAYSYRKKAAKKARRRRMRA